MMYPSLLTRAVALFALLAPIVAVAAETAPQLMANVTFPETNPFQLVVNGQRNHLTVNVENPTGVNITLTAISGSTHLKETGKLIKNLTALPIGVNLYEGAAVALPFSFYSEFRPGAMQLKVWVEYTTTADKKTKLRIDAFENLVKVVEPPASLFDIQMILTYIVVVGIVSFIGYAVYLVYYAPTTKKAGPRKIKPTAVTDENVDTEPVKGSGVYSEDWIPEHHLRSRKAKKEGAASSGDESAPSGAERRKSTRRK